MKPVSDLLHRIPWWALVGGGFALFVALALFTPPFHLIRLEHSGATPEEDRAIPREIKSPFSSCNASRLRSNLALTLSN